MRKEAIILAGGFGTRLRPVVSDVPKPMAQIGGRPFLEYILMQLSRAGYGHAVISIGYLSEIIESHFGNEWQRMQVSCSIEQEPLGTGGGVMNALPYISSAEVTVLNGDSFLELNLASFQEEHRARNADISIALTPVGDVSRYGSVSLGPDMRIQRFNEKGRHAGAGLINGGVYQLSTAMLKKMFSLKRFSLEKDVFACVRDLAIYGFKCDGYFIDIGVPEDYSRAERELPKLFAAKE